MLSAVPVQFPGNKGALGSDVPGVQSVCREVVMLPSAKDIIGDGIEIVRRVLVTIIVVVTAGEAIQWIGVSGSPRSRKG